MSFVIPVEHVNLKDLQTAREQLDVGLGWSHEENSKKEPNHDEVGLCMQGLALRIIMSLIMRLGLEKVKCALLMYGAGELEARVKEGVAGAGDFPVSLTPENVVLVANQLSRLLSGERQDFDKVFAIKDAVPLRDDSFFAERPRDRLQDKQKRFIRSRMSECATPKASVKPFYDAGESWETQLRRSTAPPSPSKRDPYNLHIDSGRGIVMQPLTTRCLSPLSTNSLHKPQKKKKKPGSKSQAEVRRGMSRAYGNFYSEQYGRDKMIRSRLANC
eukprot:CAMPEP_0203761408 /NCGR_PEP_ID=MMETSP0098-20131031/14503_1 /ASSEMBLY_ACC=CAM_ASM_000208 /TAXON_ID=96639 /ORGANISM=" , Strain NY0313808BC1" /LENGTH=272 /DNA_ID=CAMNT_0050655393 /DNA_START=243 /DNA_END=1058 /DNA_ORIENTATION=-